MKYISIDQLEQFEFHDSNWNLVSLDGDVVTFDVENLNIHKDTVQNDEDWDLELDKAWMTFRGFRLIHFEPGRSWTTDENGKSVPVGPRILYTGEEGMGHLAKKPFQVLHFDPEADHWEIGCCGVEPYFTVEFDFDSVEIVWDSYLKKAWYELHRCYRRQVTLDTPAGPITEKLEIRVHEEDVYRPKIGRIPAPSVNALIHLNGNQFMGDGKDDFLWIDAVADLQKKLPEGVSIRSCLSCRYGNLCPYGNATEQIFCLKGLEVSGKMDVCDVFDQDGVMNNRQKNYFDCCEDWACHTCERYCYNDFESYLDR